MKKLLKIFVVMMMVFTMSSPLFAAEEKGSITINKVSENTTYSIYKLLDLESYNTTTGAYSYKVAAEWVDFFETATALSYVKIDENGYVTWNTSESDSVIAEFAKKALEYAKANGIAPMKSSAVEGDFSVSVNPETGNTYGVFSDLPLGYYLVDTTMGALCGLTTTNPNASVNAKNGIPKNDKQVLEDGTNQWGGTSTADIGQTIEYRVTINVHAGAENYTLHDTMSEGLTFKSVTKVEHIKLTTDETVELVEGVDYNVYTAPGISEALDDDVEDECTFEVKFTKELCDSLEVNDKLIIYYEAMLNRNAVIASTGNPNTSRLEFGDGHYTTTDSTNTFTYGFDIVKTDSQNTLLDGATFKVYDAATGGNEIAVVLMDDGVTYRRARADEPGVKIVVKDGKARVVGFDNGTYYLEEIDAPAGYNKLTSRRQFIIADANLDAVFNDGIYSSGSGVHIVNKTGEMLPETGGFGTTMLIGFGGMVVLAAGVLLFAKKRMAQIAE